MSPIQSWFLMKTAKDMVDRRYSRLPEPVFPRRRDTEQMGSSLGISLFIVVAIVLIMFFVVFE